MNLNNIMTIIKENQILLAGIGLSGAGIITFWLKDVPRKLYSLIKREFTTDLILTSRNRVFHDLLNWIQKEYGTKNFRKLKVSNGLWGDGDSITSLGYGVHFLRFKGRLLIMNLLKEEANQSQYDKESLIITKLGRSRKIFDDMIHTVSIRNNDTTKTKIFRLQESYWDYVRQQNKRIMDSVFIEKDKKDKLISSLTTFINKEDWYIDNGIPYQLGVLLYGPPGTGKTSLIKAIAGYLNYPIYYLPAVKLDSIDNAMAILPDNCVLVIEDIDSNNITHARANINKQVDLSDNVDVDKLSDFLKSSLSEVLNALDGLFSVHGRILIATTNHIDKLDGALIRPGRIDLQIEIGYVNTEILKGFMKNFFPDSNILDIIDFINIKPCITVAMLQSMVLQEYTDLQILDEIKVQ